MHLQLSPHTAAVRGDEMTTRRFIYKEAAYMNQGVWNSEPCWWACLPEQRGENYRHTQMLACSDPADAARRVSEWNNNARKLGDIE